MQNFVFHNPTKIIFGRNNINKIGEETLFYGSRILLVYGKESIKKNGIYQQVRNSLEKAGITWIEHGGVKPNPELGHVQQGINLARLNNVEAVVAVGGGSVIDSAKAISAGALVEHDVWKFFTGKKSIRKTLPVLCVLTLAASGSEMNSAMVVTHEGKNQKFGIANKILFPKVSILDPTATFTVPPDHTAYGAVDAIAHILEFYFTTLEENTSVQDRFMEGLLINIMESCDQVMKNPTDYQGRSNLMWCATLALNGLTGAGLGKVGFPMHMIEHSLSALYDIPHGAGLSVVVPAWMAHQSEGNPTKFAQFGERVFKISKEKSSEQAAASIEKLKKWFNKIGCPTKLQDIHVPAEDISKIAQNALDLGKLWRMREYSLEKIEAVLRLCA